MGGPRPRQTTSPFRAWGSLSTLLAELPAGRAEFPIIAMGSARAVGGPSHLSSSTDCAFVRVRYERMRGNNETSPPKAISASGGGRCITAGHVAFRTGADLSGPPDHDGGAVPAWRSDGCD